MAQDINPHSFDLPVVEIISLVKSKLAQDNTLIIQAPPGAGKSTLLPLSLLRESWLSGKKIIMLEPRRLATKTIAERMASMTNTTIGDLIGYRIRFDSATSKHTKLEVITEGILTRMLHADNALEDVGLVIFDEFHERNLHSEVALALIREVQQVLRPDLRVLIMSATLDAKLLSDKLDAAVIESKGRQYPVEVTYMNELDEYKIGEDAARQIIPLTKIHQGDILVFLPGQREIRKAQEILSKTLANDLILPLYGQLSSEDQNKAIRASPAGKRKIVLSTDIAETSLTIEGVTVIVDSGYAKTSRFDPRTGLSKLVLHRISKDSADQRSGRAGRLSAGHSYRLWPKAIQNQLNAYRTPEIMEADLAGLVLDMKAWSKQDIHSMTWLTPPPSGTVALVEKTLESIEAVQDGELTQHGKDIHKLPTHPRIAHMLLNAKEANQLGLATDIAAILDERDPLGPDAGVDLNLRIEALRRYRKHHVSIARIKKIEKLATSYRRMFSIQPDNSPVDPWQTGLLLAYAYPERIAAARPGNNAQFQLANGKIAQIAHKDDLAHEAWLAVAHVDAREGMGKIWLAAPVNPRDLAPMLKSKKILKWDRKKGGLQAHQEIRIGSIVLGTRTLENYSPEDVTEAILAAIREDGAHLLDFNNDVEQLIFRVQSLRIWNSEEDWPKWSVTELCAHPEYWLAPYLQNLSKNEDLKKLNLVQILSNSLAYDLQGQLEKLAPKSIQVPSGSRVKLEYRADGEVPLLAVRLQELFGLLETPTINNEKIPVLIQLLSPGFKPVQLTQDLRSFWENGYFEVKKELKRRYPKHEWPDDPIDAKAIRGVKKRKA